MRTVDIPGGTARFKERSELRGRDVKLVKIAAMAASQALGKVPDEVTNARPGESEAETAKRVTQYLNEHPLIFSTQEAKLMLDLEETVAVVFLADWTLDIEKPTLETIGDLPGDIYNAVIAAVEGEAMRATSGVDFDPNPEQNSPTGPSSASDGSLRAEPDQTQEEPAST